jgi:patatin-like phospholipase/acyl hydrolase
MKEEPRPMKTPIRILTVDGGGVGGIIPARLLQLLSVEFPNLLVRTDLIAGTSTGGLVALGLAAGQTPAQVCDLYLTQAKNIFAPKYRRSVVWQPFWAKYVTAGLRQAVEAIVGNRKLGDLTDKPVFVPVTALSRADGRHRPAGVFLSTAYRLTSAGHEKYSSSQWSCMDVALATAAAPSYFPAHTVTAPGNWLCWDGGIVANNPALAAVGEVFRLQMAERADAARTAVAVREDQNDTPDVRVLSLGTGYRDIVIDAGDWGYTYVAQPIVNALLDTSVGSTAFLLRQLLGKKIVRVTPQIDQDYKLDDAGAVDWLNTRASDYYTNELNATVQPDGSKVDLRQWLGQYWLD